jgi:tartrate-resistant acid phosphatase type 5
MMYTLGLLASLCLSSIGATSLNFMTIGDWGEVTAAQASVASTMATWATNQPVDFIISVGDNFYDDGVASVDDPQWKTTFADVYGTSDSLKNVPWFAVLGNHDYHQNVEAQIQYSQISNGKWNMDGHYFARNFSFDGTTAKFIYIDTIWFGPEVSGKTPVDNQPAKFAEQLAWLEAELKASTSFDWLIVTGHYPLFSEGDGDDTTMQGVLQNLLEQYQVDAYISGHDHTMQHLTQNNVQYYISGTGAIQGKLKSTSVATVNFAKVEPGFTSHQITGKNMLVQYVEGGSGNVMYQFTQQAKDRSQISSFAVDASISSPTVTVHDNSSNIAIVGVSLAVFASVFAAIAVYVTRNSKAMLAKHPSEIAHLV